jgi:hypothetical protein
MNASPHEPARPSCLRLLLDHFAGSRTGEVARALPRSLLGALEAPDVPDRGHDGERHDHVDLRDGHQDSQRRLGASFHGGRVSNEILSVFALRCRARPAGFAGLETIDAAPAGMASHRMARGRKRADEILAFSPARRHALPAPHLLRETLATMRKDAAQRTGTPGAKKARKGRRRAFQRLASRPDREAAPAGPSPGGGGHGWRRFVGCANHIAVTHWPSPALSASASSAEATPLSATRHSRRRTSRLSRPSRRASQAGRSAARSSRRVPARGRRRP